MLLLAVHEVVISLYWPTFRRLRLRQSLKESNRFVKVFGQTPPQFYTDPDYARKSRITRTATLTSSQVRRPIEVLDDGRTRWTWKQYETQTDNVSYCFQVQRVRPSSRTSIGRRTCEEVRVAVRVIRDFRA
ncbi:hypothetical protein Y032_0367g33 [Ancylostoma ceylanicum]|uniref:Uncharacterized protein n=1 Tax=Ancylostoma ceylanicum TaxID=53326 RepID=A0A016RVU9_9BILA|nr:hypothetical protein Y032_0367g33 [Ancylostoma ceylanicum]